MSLKVVLGPMFSGKTTFLLSEIEKYKPFYKILCINHSNDSKRYTMDIDCFRTHDNKSYKAHMLNLIHDIYNNNDIYQEYLNADIIIIDEGQFFTDLFTFLYNEFKINTTKHFIVAGLKSDYLMKPIGDMCPIISMADEVLELYAYCKYCNNKALFTRLTEKIVSSDMQIIGGEKMYEPVCRTHLKY